jgi:hypothetical protein
MNKFLSLFCRAAAVYALALLFVFVAVDHKKVAGHSWPKTLSRLRVNYAYLIAAADGGGVQRAALIDGIRYFNAIVRIFGARPDTDAFLGMSEYYSGNPDAARKHFLSLSREASGFFWGYYNLALLAYQQKDFGAMARYCQQAFQCPLDKSLAFMAGSKVYQPLLVENGLTPALLAQNMQNGQHLLLQLLISVKNGDLPSGDRLPVRVF